MYIEDSIPEVKYNNFKTQKAATFESTVAVTGASIFTGVATFSAAPVFSAGTTRAVNINALVGATVVLTAANSGSVNINRSTSGTPSWTLPTNVAGLNYTFVVASTTAGFTVTGGTIFAKANAAGASVTGTTLTNTQATAVIGDSIELVCDGTSWRVINQTGIFAAA